MKRSEMVEHIQTELKDMLESIKNRPNAAKYQPARFAQSILDMIEGFGMLPPPSRLQIGITESVAYVHYDEPGQYCLNLEDLQLWEPEEIVKKARENEFEVYMKPKKEHKKESK